MAGAHLFQAVQHPKLDMLGLVAIRDFLKERAHYLRLVPQDNKVDGVIFMRITVVASIDPELLEDLIDTETVDAETVDDCADKSVMEYLESTRELGASVTAEYLKVEVLANMSFTMLEKDPALGVTKARKAQKKMHLMY
jgi:hypothetical protein